MRNSRQPLVSIRSLDTYGTRRLNTRGSLPRDFDKLESVSFRQSMRSVVKHFSYLRVTKISAGKRWLRQQAGRAWNDVYSELCANYRSQPQVADVALQNLLAQVERNVFVAPDGQLMAQGAYDTYNVQGLYVHPATGVLQYRDGFENSAKLRKQRKEERAAQKAQKQVKVSDTLQLHKLDDWWFWIELAQITAPQHRIHPDYVCRDGTRIKGRVEVMLDTVCIDVLTQCTRCASSGLQAGVSGETYLVNALLSLTLNQIKMLP